MDRRFGSGRAASFPCAQHWQILKGLGERDLLLDQRETRPGPPWIKAGRLTFRSCFVVARSGFAGGCCPVSLTCLA